MPRKRFKKIQRAVDRGNLVPFEEIFSRYSKKKQERIIERARYLKIAMMLRTLRRRQRLSQGELAKKMEVKREFISRIESGRQNLTIETLYRIGRVMGKDVEVQFK